MMTAAFPLPSFIAANCFAADYTDVNKEIYLQEIEYPWASKAFQISATPLTRMIILLERKTTLNAVISRNEMTFIGDVSTCTVHPFKICRKDCGKQFRDLFSLFTRQIGNLGQGTKNLGNGSDPLLSPDLKIIFQLAK